MALIEFKREQSIDEAFRKFGYNSDIDTNTDPEDIWDYGGLYTFGSDSGETIRISSDNTGDTGSFIVQGLDENFLNKSVTLNLSGQTPVTLGTFSRVFRGFNAGSTDLNGNVYSYGTGAVATGTPQSASMIRSMVKPIYQQTQMAIYTVPANHTAYICDVTCSSPRLANQTIAVEMRLDVRQFGKVFRNQLVFGVNDSLYQDVLFAPIKVPAKSDIRLRAQKVYANNTPVAASFDLILKRDLT
jgi:hypothetical protein|tara:strand:+ start:4633 stop:5361 length:729 start_codon:yes stop_codon:yes gene_type:complete